MSQPTSPAPLVEIIPVSGALPAVRLGSGFASLVEALNPLGTVGKALVEIIAYRAEMKRLSVERERVLAQAKVLGQTYEAHFREQMATIDMHRQAIFYCFQQAEMNLHERRMTRNSLTQALSGAMGQMNQLFSGHPSPEQLQTFREIVEHITKSLVAIERQSSAELMELSKDLHKVVQEVHQDIRVIPPVAHRSLPSSS